jgi:hypothetical protein
LAYTASATNKLLLHQAQKGTGHRHTSFQQFNRPAVQPW